MLPESKFPVTGGIMQSEEVAGRTPSAGLDGSVPECRGTFDQSVQLTQHIQYPLQLAVSMAVKQEPQEEEEEEEEQIRQAQTLSPQTESEDVQSLPEGNFNHKRITKQTNTELDALNAQVPKNASKKQPSRGRRKSRWKLKFHHQALPPEYLDHYEAALAQEAALNSTTPPVSNDSRIVSPSTNPLIQPPFTSSPNSLNDVQSWLHRFAVMQNETCPVQTPHCPLPSPSLYQSSNARRSVITSTQSSNSASPAAYPLFGYQPEQPQPNHNVQPQTSTRPPMKYSDLPYMGEITLDNNKPRRGRKPKKADICHLIYKNYGTILPGTPGLEDKSKLSLPKDKAVDSRDTQLSMSLQRTDIQNRISSLLEKRLTQERRALEIPAESIKEQDKPLNLCIRDLNLLKIRLGEKHNNLLAYYQSKSEGSSDAEDIEYLGAYGQQNLTESEPQADLKNVVSETDGKVYYNKINNNNGVNSNTNNGNDDNNHNSHNNHNQDHSSNNDNNNNSDDRLANDATDNGETDANRNNFINNCTNNNNNNNSDSSKQKSELLYWPNAGVLIHPVALQSQFLYYQKLAQEKGLTLATEQTSKEQQQPPQQPQQQQIVPKSIYSMMETAKTPGILSSEASADVPAAVVPVPAAKTKRGSAQSLNQPVKRKRSAIFIPPMPTENNSNPATEVSICKFKFTGGAKPTLQEKKSLSVDSGGNFRYYSGTGDKSMRGYEFFPRESLQQQHQATSQPSGSSSSSAPSGSYFNAAAAVAAAAAAAAAADRLPTPALLDHPSRMSAGQDDSRRKRKTRKSIQREKLEQTFKEKGFLIQTQQLESAEGATYCKFRQLRKFTRYLFRSWKDYLPGNVRELSAESAEAIVGPKDGGDQEQNIVVANTLTTSASPPLPMVNVEQERTSIENTSPGLPLH